MSRATGSRLKIDVVADSTLWKDVHNVRPLLRRVVAQAAAALSTKGTELAIVLTDDSAIRSLNRLWRGIDAATNVLSFPAKPVGHEPSHLGDIVLAYETVAREANAERKPLAHHVAHLAVHGFLHLLGHDHQRIKDAAMMEDLERKILRRLAIPDPYRHSTAPTKPRRQPALKPRRN